MKEIDFYDVYMIRNTMEEIPAYELPNGYSYCFYQQGLDEDWTNIQLGANAIDSVIEGKQIFERTFVPHEHTLNKRMIFIENENKEKIATATAFFIEEENKEVAKLHWIATTQKEQGKGLAKPLLYKTMETMKQLGYKKCILHTQTTSYKAVNMYLSFGFIPYEKEKNQQGWLLLEELLDKKIT